MRQRNIGRYRITAVRLEIVGDRPLAERISKEVRLPAPPADELTESQLLTYLRQLVQPAQQAFSMLSKREHAERTKRYSRPPYQRVLILVVNDNRVWGYVMGSGRIFDTRGPSRQAVRRRRLGRRVSGPTPR